MLDSPEHQCPLSSICFSRSSFIAFLQSLVSSGVSSWFPAARADPRWRISSSASRNRMIVISTMVRIVVFLCVVQMVLARGKPINIFEQKAGEDIAEPRDERVYSYFFATFFFFSVQKENTRNSQRSLAYPCF
ncbi:hypothetical protein NECAME_14386 [Necator americanus]|uniref:Uncharacterized protein n=1 Tax=Necator americanus TaxID=51031 RepID=W2SQS8_NECAM|nr:hypothetical protein NECAME_14386 [Necator americanus]ETN71052.1 hypothetical protein NECAME_14386 [Necator americanus]